MSKVLTIIVPAYNMEKYLERCLSSLLVDDSLMQQFEVLVVNDGSKDRTSEIAHMFEKNYPDTFRVIDKKNGHYGSCVNRGLAEAKGTFVKILDADDSFNNTAFSSFLGFLSEEEITNHADAVLSDFSEIEESGRVHRIQHYSDQSRLFQIENLSSSDRIEWFVHGLSYKTELLHRINYRQTEGIAYTDQEWSFIPMSYVGFLARFDSTPLYCYSVGREGQSVDDSVHVKNLWMEVDVLERLIEDFLKTKKNVDEHHRTFLFDRLVMMITHIYQLYLVAFNKRTPKDRLSRFDEWFRDKSPELYEATGKYATRICGITFHPINNWRFHRNFIMAVQSLLYNLADIIVKMQK